MRQNAKAVSCRNIAVDERGAITVTFDGQGAAVQRILQSHPDTYQVRWRCRTSGDPDLTHH